MMKEEISPEIKAHRKFNYPLHPLISNRWSPRAMSGEELNEEELMPLFEAARWAPSSYNNQHWRFIYARKNTPEWNALFDLMVEFNQKWAKNASCLVVVLSKTTFDKNGKPVRTHSFDTGAAWMSLALEATHRGYVTHAMEGFDYDKAKQVLAIPHDHAVEAMVAIGKPAPKESLPKEMQDAEVPPDRRPLIEIIMKGKFRATLGS